MLPMSQSFSFVMVATGYDQWTAVNCCSLLFLSLGVACSPISYEVLDTRWSHYSVCGTGLKTEEYLKNGSNLSLPLSTVFPLM